VIHVHSPVEHGRAHPLDEEGVSRLAGEGEDGGGVGRPHVRPDLLLLAGLALVLGGVRPDPQPVLRVRLQLGQGVHYGRLVLGDRLHGGDVAGGEVQPVALDVAVGAGWLPPGELEAGVRHGQHLGVPGRGGRPLVRHDHHDGVGPGALGVEDAQGDEVLGEHGELLQGVGLGLRIRYGDFCGLLGSRVPGPVADQVTTELPI